ncbi:MAG: galactitol-1-phosphate 5-dehydrogenase [Roseburia sp.]|nr:galactitol-1-phosphate 5-dehydrogenase [Roseburia sp.]
MREEWIEKIPESGKMMAANLHAVADLKYEEVDIPECGEDEVLVKIKKCGICGSDVGRILAHGTYHFPTIPGHEFAGQVIYDKTGEHTGKRVAVFPILPCFACDMCAEENYAECRNYDYYGSRRDGGYAEYIAVKKWNLVELPDNVSYEEGAMCEPVSVALHAIKKLEIKEGETLLVTGAGPIGLIAGMWAKSFGAATVSYVDIDADKITFAKSLGFEEYDGKSFVDAALEGTGASSAIAAAIGAVNPFGRMVLMGNPGRDIALSAKDYQNILRKELKINGTWNSVYASHDNNWKDSLQAISEGKLNVRQLITHSPSIAEAEKAVKMMRDRSEFYCKVVIDNEK